MAGLVAIIRGGCKRGKKGKKVKANMEEERRSCGGAGSLPESTTLNQVNSITNRISRRKSRAKRRYDAAGGEGRWASDENQTSGHSCSEL